MLLYLYSWDLGQWLIGGVSFVGGIPDMAAVFPIGNAAQFVRDSDNLMLIRIQTISQPFLPDYQVFHDWIGVGVS